MNPCNPAEELSFAIAEQACADMMLMRRAGIVVDGEIRREFTERPYWRNGSARKRYGYYYDSPGKVRQLIAFFIDGTFHRHLDVLGSALDPTAIMRRIGFTASQCSQAERAARCVGLSEKRVLTIFSRPTKVCVSETRRSNAAQGAACRSSSKFALMSLS